ncbi:MAG: hypothetical protein M3P45_05170 [Acidobacteriota bacterium]|nr:hypothetical protein [Acidobacteriota bacterium]
MTAAGGRAPWLLAPVIAMLAYGYTFNMGFFNYYLSVGLACFALAIFWPPRKSTRKQDCIVGALLLGLGVLAHPIGPLWCLVTLAYLSVRGIFPGFWRFSAPAAAVGIAVAAHWCMARLTALEVSWPDKPFYFFNGADQLHVYTPLYRLVAAAQVVIFVAWIAWSVYQRRDRASFLKTFLLLSELYLVSVCVIAMLPQDIRMGLYSAWIGLLVSRLTLVSAIFALGALNCLKPGKWVLISGAACAAIFFTLLYRDTLLINRLELRAEEITRTLPFGTRVIPTLEPRPDSRISFVGHVIDRACIARCFTYSNYEPSSLQFRVRVAPGSPIATASAGDSQEMEAGNYVVQPADPSLLDIYQCSPADFTIVCARQLAVGEKTGQAGDSE